MAVNLPRPFGMQGGMVDYMNRLAEALEAELQRMQATQADPYVVTNGTATRTFDANGTSLAATNQVLATLIADLQKKGSLR